MGTHNGMASDGDHQVTSDELLAANSDRIQTEVAEARSGPEREFCPLTALLVNSSRQSVVFLRVLRGSGNL